MKNLNTLLTKKYFLKLFNTAIGGILRTYNGAYEVEFKVLDVIKHEPELTFEECYNLGASYVYKLDVKILVSILANDTKDLYSDFNYVKVSKRLQDLGLVKDTSKIIMKSDISSNSNLIVDYGIDFDISDADNTIYTDKLNLDLDKLILGDVSKLEKDGITIDNISNGLNIKLDLSSYDAYVKSLESILNNGQFDLGFNTYYIEDDYNKNYFGDYKTFKLEDGSDITITNYQFDLGKYTEILNVSLEFPKFQQYGIFYKSSNKTNIKFRVPVVKAIENDVTWLYDNLLRCKGAFTYDLDNMICFSNYLEEFTPIKMLENNVPIHPLVADKLSLQLGVKISNNIYSEELGEYVTLTPEVSKQISEIYNNCIEENSFTIFNTYTPLDFKFKNILDSSIDNAKNIKVNRAMNRRMAIKNFRTSGINPNVVANWLKALINRSFTINKDSQDVKTADETNTMSYLNQSESLYFYNSQGTKISLEYNESFIGVICPVNSPEGNNINLKNTKTIGSSFEDGEVTIKVYTKEFEPKMISLLEYYKSKVLVCSHVDYDNKLINDENGLYTYKQGIYAETSETNSLDIIDYLESPSYNRFSYAAAVIPGLNFNDSVRGSMACKMLTQAVGCKGSEPALVYTGIEKDIFNNSSKVTKSPVEGRVVEVTDEFITIEPNDSTELVKLEKPQE